MNKKCYLQARYINAYTKKILKFRTNKPIDNKDI